MFDLCLFPGVIAVSWYPPGLKDDNGEPTDDFVPLLLEVAHKYHIKVCMQILMSLITQKLMKCLMCSHLITWTIYQLADKNQLIWKLYKFTE